MPMTYIKENLAATKAQLAAAMQEAGRQDECVVLAAVKYAVPGEIEALLDAGVTDVGENRVQRSTRISLRLRSKSALHKKGA